MESLVYCAVVVTAPTLRLIEQQCRLLQESLKTNIEDGLTFVCVERQTDRYITTHVLNFPSLL